MNITENEINWTPIDEFDKETMDRVPMLLHDPDWYTKPNIGTTGFGYHDKYFGWNVSIFEPCSAYAMVQHSAFKPKFFALIARF